MLVALRAIIVKVPWIRVGSVRIHLAKLKWQEVIRSCSLRDPHLAKVEDPLTDGCQGTKDFFA